MSNLSCFLNQGEQVNYLSVEEKAVNLKTYLCCLSV